MAKTKRRRKHRGTQAGTIARSADSRARRAKGGAARPGDRAEARENARRRRTERLDRPPTWRGALNRAAIAASIVAVLGVVVLRNRVPQAIALAAVMLVIYIPLGYGFDAVVYRLRQRRKQGGASAGSGGGSGRGRAGRGR